MSELTPRLGIKKPLGNETVSRAAFNDNWDIIDSGVATRSELDTHIGAGGDIHAVATVSSAGFMSATDKARLEAIVFPPGLIAHFARPTPPTGWLECNGQTISRTTYADLFAAIGTTFGSGDGSTTFKVPDLRGEFVRGWDHGRGVDSGRVFGSWQADEYKAHRHAVIPYSGVEGTNANAHINSATNGASYDFTSTVGGTETRSRNVALLACIKY